MKTILILYPHWPPSNLVGMHRVRLIANHLSGCGWHPIVLTVQPDFYEEKPDPELEQMIHPAVEVIRVAACPVLRILGKRILGDIGLRAFPYLYMQALQLIQTRNIDFLWISIPSWYPALLGRILHFKTGIQYGIDYQDPWISKLAPYHGALSRAGWTKQLARVLEPVAVRKAALLTGVAAAYYRPVLARYFKTKPIAHAEMQLGFDPADYTVPPGNIPFPWPSDGSVTPYLYAGAFLPQAHLFIRHLCMAASQLKQKGEWPAKARFYFIGTGQYKGKRLADYAFEYGVDDLMIEIRDRFPYLHVLHFLSAAEGVLIIGSIEKHYTASKTFQCLLSGRPILAILHEASPGAGILRQCKADHYLTEYQEGATEAEFQQATRAVLQRYLHRNSNWSPDLKTIQAYSARSAARILVNAIEKVLS